MVRVPRLFLTCFLTLVALSLFSQDGPDTETAEASPYLLDFSLGDAGVNVIWEGYWRIRLVSGGSFGKKTAANAFNGLSSGVVFAQEPDLTLSVRLNQAWFIETTFLEGFDKNVYRAGYRGTGFLKSLTVGNAGINASGFAGLQVASPKANTPGVSASFASGTSSHELLIRYDPTQTETKTFRGNYQVERQNLRLSEYVRGRYFMLPDTNVSNVVIYLEDPQGTITGTDLMRTNRQYRRVLPAEYFVDRDEGLVELASPHTGQVLVFYTSAAGDIGSPGGGIGAVASPDSLGRPDAAEAAADFNWNAPNPYDPKNRNFQVTSQVSVNGTDALILYAPGYFSPFERLNRYLSALPLPKEDWRIITLINEKGSLYPVSAPGFSFVAEPENKILKVFGAPGSGERDFLNRFPFSKTDPQAYGNLSVSEEELFSRTLVLGIRSSSPGYQLGSGVVPDSLTVRINGREDASARILSSGSIKFTRAIHPDDWIEAEYRVESTVFGKGDLFIYQGNRFEITPQFNLELAESLRWNLNSDKMTEEYGKSPGEARLSGTLLWETDNALVDAAVRGSLKSADTTGNLRLFGMDSAGLSPVFSTSTLKKAPDDVISTVTGGRSPATGYSYVSYDVFGNALLGDYLWSGAASTGKDAPSAASRRTGDPGSGAVMEIRFDLKDDEWTAGDALVDTTAPVNASSASAVEIELQFRKDHGTATTGPPPTVYLEAGEIGESADHQNDGLQSPDTGRSLSLNLNTRADLSYGSIKEAWKNPGTWQTIRLTLSAADKASLSSLRSIRLVIDSKGAGSAVSGRLIAAAPRFATPPFLTEIRTSAGTPAAAQSVGTDTVPATDLSSSFSEVSSVFHPNGGTNQALRLRWGSRVHGGTALAATDRWQAVSWMEPVPADSYGTLSFYLKDPGGSGPLTLKLTDPQKRGITLSWTPGGTGNWEKITVDMAAKTASATGGGTVSTTIDSLTIDSLTGSFTRLTLTGADADGSTAASARSGEILIDEIHFSNPVYSISGTGELGGRWSYSRDIWTLAGIPMLGNIAVEGRLKGFGSRNLSGLTSNEAGLSGGAFVQAYLLGAEIKADWHGNRSTAGNGWSGAHEIRIPARSQTFWLEDSYSRSAGTAGSSTSGTHSRSSLMHFSLAGFSTEISGSALYNGEKLNQSWGGFAAWNSSRVSLYLDAGYILTTTGNPSPAGSSEIQNYLHSWIRGYTLLVPRTTALQSRRAGHSASLEIKLPVLTIQWTPLLSAQQTLDPIWSQQNRWEELLSLPLTFETWSLTPSYRRSLRQTLPAEGFVSDYNGLFALLGPKIAGGLPLTTYIPFAEFFGNAEKFTRTTRGMTRAVYETQASLAAHRSPFPDYPDLFIPSAASISMQRTYERKGDTVGWKNLWETALDFKSLNLFGQFGRRHVFSFYNSDEITSSLALTLSDFDGTGPPSPRNFLWEFNLAFRGARDRRLILDHRLYWDWNSTARHTTEEGRIRYSWRSNSQTALRIPFLGLAIPYENYVEHTEELLINGTHPWSDAPSKSVRNIGFILSHQSRWVFPDAGHLKAKLALGLGGRGTTFTNAWELSLEAEFRF